MRFRIALRVSLMTLAAAAAPVGPIEHAGATESPEPVTFPSADGKTPSRAICSSRQRRRQAASRRW
jgi:hypothetical protein